MATNAAPDYTPIYQAAAQEWNVDPALLQAVAGQESGGSAGRDSVVSPAGAIGHMQLMPDTAKGLGVADPTDPVQSIYGGAKYLSQMLDKYQKPELALAAYNAGPGRVDAYLAGQGSLPNETLAYVPSVTQRYQAIAAPKQVAAPQQAAASTPDPVLKALGLPPDPAPAAPAQPAPAAAPDPFTAALNGAQAPAATTNDPFSQALSAGQPAAAADPFSTALAAAQPAPAPPEPSVLQKIGAGLGRAAHDLTDAPAELLARGADALGLTSGQAAQTAAADQAGLQGYNQQYGDSTIAGAARVGGQIAGVVPVLASGGSLAGGLGDIAAAGAGRIAPALGNIVAGGNALTGGTLGAGANGLGGLAVRGASLATNGALTGGAAGALTAGQSSDPLSQQIQTGAASGAVLGPAAGAVGSLLRGGASALTGLGGGASPEVAQLARTARDTYNIPITAPQISSNSLVRIANDQSSKLPFSGAGAVQDAQQTAFQTAVANEMGENAARITPAVMDAAATRNAATMDAISNRTAIQFTPQNTQNLQNIVTNASRVLPQSEVAPLAAQIADIGDLIQASNGVLSGQSYQALTRANTPLDRLSQSADPNVAHYAQQIRNEIDNAFQASASPQDQQALQQARYQWRVMKTIQPLAEKSTDGNISPALLMGAVRNASSRFDGSTGGMAYTGGGPLGDLARIGQAFMKTPPNSGTPDRTLVNSLMLGQGSLGGLAYAGAVNPLSLAATPAALIGNRLAGNYLRSGAYANNVINSSLGNNALAAGAGRVLNGVVPYAAPIGAARYNALTGGQPTGG